MYQIRAEQIQFVIQSDKLAHQLVLHLAVHQFIVPTIAATRLGAYKCCGAIATSLPNVRDRGSMAVRAKTRVVKTLIASKILERDRVVHLVQGF